MLYPFATVALLPFLLLQGRKVRRDTPRLPEPQGDRCGESGAGDSLRVLILGDSAAAGVGATTQAEALSGQLVSALSKQRRVRWTLLAKTGHTSADVLDTLQRQPAETFDVALVSVGVNDVTGRTGSKAWVANVRALAASLRDRFGVRHILFTSVPPMHQFPALPQPLRWYLGLRARQLNKLLETLCDAEPACQLLAVPFPFEQELMASDGFHPGSEAYALWGQHGAKVIGGLR